MTKPDAAGSSTTGPGEAAEGTSFAVNLDSLKQIEQRLGDMLSGLSETNGRTRLDPTPAPFGLFPEAETVSQKQAAAIASMQTVMAELRDAIEFAQRVTLVVATRYAEYESRATGNIERILRS